MPGFALTPQGGFPPETPEQFPNYIQFRFNGVDLGGPDATVVDFVGGGFSVARGTGDDADKITVTVS
jgi:hypothetical protein